MSEALQVPSPEVSPNSSTEERQNYAKKITKLVPLKLRRMFGGGRKDDGSSTTRLNTSLNSSHNIGHIDEVDGSPIHPDIEEGVRHILEEQLVEMTRTGNVAGIKLGIIALGDAWKQAQKASGDALELTDEGKQEIPARVRKICAQHLSEGLAQIYSVADFGIKEGWEGSIESEPKRVARLFQIADEFQIPISCIPSQDGAANRSMAPITSSEQALSYMQGLIDRNLPEGLLGIVKTLGFQVSQGLLKELPDYEKRIERWISIMEKRGWTVVDQPVTPIAEGETREGLVPMQVNKAEVRQLVDEVVYANLAKGASYISEMVAFQVKTGWINPLKFWGSPENITLYTEAGKQYGLAHSGGIVSKDNKVVNPDLYFDPTTLPEQIRSAVKKHLPEGIEAIEAQHLQSIGEGDVEQIELSEKTLEEYVNLAVEYDVQMAPDRLRRRMSEHIVVANLQRGVKARVAAVKEALRRANYIDVSVQSRKAEQFRRFVHERGFDDQVDFTELDSYLKETATKAPQLSSGI